MNDLTRKVSFAGLIALISLCTNPVALAAPVVSGPESLAQGAPTTVVVIAPTATPTPTETPTPTATSTPTPAPTATPVKCHFFDLTGWSDGSGGRSTPKSFVSWIDQSHWGKLVFQAIGAHKPESAMPPCLTSILASQNITNSTVIRGRANDWPLAGIFRRLGQAFFATMTPAQQWAYNRQVWGNNAPLSGLLNDPGRSSRFMDRFIMDENCQVVPYPPEPLICGRYIHRWDATPIGLVFDEAAVSDFASIVEFNLESGKGDETRYSLWRASGGFPLVVFDPRHTGVVDSAFQLFGTWSFGGKTDASAPGGLGPWSDGYEALASLDTNADHSLSGSELDSLSLWFDRNRDGVSDPEEVLRVSEVGITRISTTFDSVDEASGDIVSVRGYDRETLDGPVTGRSIDWMSLTSSSKTELVETLQRKARLTSKSQRVATSENSGDTRVTQASVAKVSTTDIPLLGQWRWRLEKVGATEFGTEGAFEFSTTPTGLTGLNIVLRPLVDSRSGKVVRDVELLPLRKVRSTSEKGLTKVSFSVLAHDGSTIENTATVSGTAQTMTGIAQQTFTMSDGPTTIQYAWNATRIK